MTLRDKWDQMSSQRSRKGGGVRLSEGVSRSISSSASYRMESNAKESKAATASKWNSQIIGAWRMELIGGSNSGGFRHFQEQLFQHKTCAVYVGMTAFECEVCLQ